MPPPESYDHPLRGPADYTFTTTVHSDTYPAISPLHHSLSGAAVFIAGASRGLGQAIAISFARAGASHIAIGARSSLDQTAAGIRSAAAEAQREKPQILELELDVSAPASVDGAAERIRTAFGGRLDVLVICAGVLARGTVDQEGDPEVWMKVIRTNLFGPYLLARACMALVRASEIRTILAVSSVGALLTMPGMSAYQIAKLGTTRLMEFIENENKGEVVALSVHPGNMPTEMVGFGKGVSEVLQPVFVDTVGLAADSIVFLTKERRQWLSGRYINCTWNMPELVSPAKRKQIVTGDKLKVKLVV